MSDEVLRAIGRLEGKMEGIESKVDETHQAVSNVDARLRNVEMRSAATGAVAGSLAGVGVAIIIATIKGSFTPGGA